MIALELLGIAGTAWLAGCTDGIDPQWQLDHDRVIAVRATPPRILSGEVAQLDALLGYRAQPPGEAEPDTAEVISPTSLQGALSHQATHWTVTAPGAAQLVATRAELGLAADAAIPLQVRVKFTAAGLSATKIVWLGEHAVNPVIDPVTVDGRDARSSAALAVAAGVDLPLAVDFDDTHNVNWLTSCGTMHDFDLARAYLRVEPADPHAGTLAVVVRDPRGGVAWRIWPITAE